MERRVNSSTKKRYAVNVPAQGLSKDELKAIVASAATIRAWVTRTDPAAVMDDAAVRAAWHTAERHFELGCTLHRQARLMVTDEARTSDLANAVWAVVDAGIDFEREDFFTVFGFGPLHWSMLRTDPEVMRRVWKSHRHDATWSAKAVAMGLSDAEAQANRLLTSLEAITRMPEGFQWGGNQEDVGETVSKVMTGPDGQAVLRVQVDLGTGAAALFVPPNTLKPVDILPAPLLTKSLTPRICGATEYAFALHCLDQASSGTPRDEAMLSALRHWVGQWAKAGVTEHWKNEGSLRARAMVAALSPDFAAYARQAYDYFFPQLDAGADGDVAELPVNAAYLCSLLASEGVRTWQGREPGRYLWSAEQGAGSDIVYPSAELAAFDALLALRGDLWSDQMEVDADTPDFLSYCEQRVGEHGVVPAVAAHLRAALGEAVSDDADALRSDCDLVIALEAGSQREAAVEGLLKRLANMGQMPDRGPWRSRDAAHYAQAMRRAMAIDERAFLTRTPSFGM